MRTVLFDEVAEPEGLRDVPAGTTDAVLGDQVRDRPALLPPGTRVGFVPA